MWTHLFALAFADCMSGSLSVMPDVGSVVPPPRSWWCTPTAPVGRSSST